MDRFGCCFYRIIIIAYMRSARMISRKEDRVLYYTTRLLTSFVNTFCPHYIEVEWAIDPLLYVHPPNPFSFSLSPL